MDAAPKSSAGATGQRSELIALARYGCTSCLGTGLVVSRGATTACGCVLRRICRACVEKYRYVQEYRRSVGPVIERRSGRTGLVYGRRNEEFCADFQLVARRSLSAIEYVIVKQYLLGCREWPAVAAMLKMSRENFFAAVYRAEARLGQALRECAPYALYPLHEYFTDAAYLRKR